MDHAAFRRLLTQFCRTHLGEGELAGCERLSGGANMLSWGFEWGGLPFVMRQLPAGVSSTDNPADRAEGGSAISLSTQADLIDLAARCGVSAPTVVAQLTPGDGLGEGFVMKRAAGETLPQSIFRNPAMETAIARLPAHCARELAKIHAIDTSAVPAELEAHSPARLLSEQEATYRALGGAIAAYDAAFGWLAAHCPPEVTPRLLHGDFRMGNLVIDTDGITAVLDWELAHLGDPVQDLAYLCVPSWRFGNWHAQAGGFGSRAELVAAYEEASGTPVEPSRFDWWLVYSTLWWGICCLRMGQSWRDGSQRILERPLIGRRVSEVEIDLLLLLEDKRGASETLCWQEPQPDWESGETGYDELLVALRGREKSRLSAVTGHDRFEALMSVNALGIAQRHAQFGPAFQQSRQARLAAMGSDAQALGAQLRDDWTRLTDSDVWRHLRLTAMERLTVDQPSYAGLTVAKERWT